MAIGSGLGAQFGFIPEVTVGAPLAVTHFAEFDDESLSLDLSWLENEGIRAGNKFKRSARLGVSRKTVGGGVTLKHAYKGMGALWKQALGSSATATQILATTAYSQVHTPVAIDGKSMTVQVGRPQPDGTVVPYTWNGCKVTDWEFSVSDNEAATLKLTLDAWNETLATGLVAASYVDPNPVWDFSDVTAFKLGGVASTVGGVTSIAGGVTVTTVANEFTLKGESPLANERYGLGNAGIKKEQIENDYPSITGSLSAEFNKTELYDLFAAQTKTALQLDLSAGDAGGANPFLLSFILPAVYFKKAEPQVDGADIVAMDLDFEAYSDGTNPVIQVKIVSSDTAI